VAVYAPHLGAEGSHPHALQCRADGLRHLDCRTDKDCEWPLNCTADERAQRYHCLASECETDLQCEPGHVCRAVDIERPVRLCKAIGVRKEGERCTPDSADRKHSCGSGLLCLRSYCGRPCRPEDPSSCQRGTACVDSLLNGHACVPRCSPGECPQGEECVRFDDELAVCGAVVTDNCDRNPCPPGQLCDRGLVGRDGRIAMRCSPTCGPDNPCPQGWSCFSKKCLQRCGQNEECRSMEECSLFPDMRSSFCVLRRR
jgi:hypothetical protein